jgi:amino acid permease
MVSGHMVNDAAGSFANYAGRFIYPALSFSLGWNYAFLWFGILAAEYNNLGLGMSRVSCLVSCSTRANGGP